MLQAEIDRDFFDLVYSDFSVIDEGTMEDHAFNYVLADNGLMS